MVYLHAEQWRNATIWCPPAHFLPPPQIFYCLQKKKEKKGATFFSVFLIGFLPPWSFLYPQIFFSRRPNAKLAELWYILLLCQTIFRLKNCKFGNMPPHKVPPPCIAGVAGAVVTPLMRKLSGKRVIELKSLPPTEQAEVQHILKIYCQVANLYRHCS